MDVDRLIIDFNQKKNLTKNDFIHFLYNILEKEKFAKKNKNMVYEIVFVNAENFIMDNLDSFNYGIKLIRKYIKDGRRISIQLNINNIEILKLFNQLSLTQLNIFNKNNNWINWLNNNNCVIIDKDENNIYAISANIGLIHIFLSDEKNFNLPSKPLHRFINSINEKPSIELVVRPI